MMRELDATPEVFGIYDSARVTNLASVDVLADVTDTAEREAGVFPVAALTDLTEGATR